MTREVTIIEEALAAIRNELGSPSESDLVATREQLSRVERELVDMLDDVQGSRTGRDRSGLGRMVTDSWPLQHPLTERVCEAVQAYSACCRGSA